ncbi:hypothetical protein AB833_24930 [Chromatiales bacterium (ex Bugula neritina AB1)]|nr:hypothetical protein AB833_24930 [Chromatiales bacterium (ex Bugula neritina AB1)]
MPDKPAVNFQCPVCRARQPLQSQCRRCQADLSLVVKVRERINYLARLRESLPDSDSRLPAIADELHLLAPNLLPAEPE